MISPQALEQPPAAPLRSVIGALWSPWTAVVAVGGIVLRWLLLRSPAGYLNSDEAYTGLAAMGVLDGRLPIVLDGNRYTAVFEAYLFAPVVAVAGPRIVLLKLVPIAAWAVAAVLTYLSGYVLAAQLRTHVGVERYVGALAATFVWLTPGALAIVSTRAYPSYALGMATCTATLLAAARLIDRDVPDVVASAVLGVLAGLGFWMHPMFLSAIVPLIAVVAVAHHRHVTSFWVPAVVGGLVGCGPFVAWNLVNGFPSLDVQNALPGTYSDRLRAFFAETLPRAFGLRRADFGWIFGDVVGPAAYVGLLAIVAAGCVVLVARGSGRSRWLVPITLVAVWPLMALFSPLIYSDDGRYAIIAFPFMAIAAAVLVATLPDRIAAVPRRFVSAVAAVAVVWVAVLVWPHTADVTRGGGTDANADTQAAIAFLDEHGIERIAGSYWRVLVIEYLSDRAIIGAVTWPDPVRFPDRQREVEASDPGSVAFVFPPWAERPEMLWLPPDRYERVEVDATIVYLPIAAT